MKNLRTMTLLTAAVLGLSTSLPAQQADSTRTEATDRPMPMMEQSGMRQDSGMDAMMPMMKMMRHCRTMMMKTDSSGMDEMSGMQMGAMPMMTAGDAGAGHALRHRDRLELTEEQVRALRELEAETRAERRAAMKRMHEAHEAMRTAAVREREQVQEVLSPEQREQLPETGEAQSMPMKKDCPMRHRGAGTEPDSTSSAGDSS